MTPPVLPATRDERIALARATIADLLDDGDQLDAEPTTSLENPALVMFRVQVPDESRAAELCADVAEATGNAGFPAISYGSLPPADDAYRVAIYVQVGAP